MRGKEEINKLPSELIDNELVQPLNLYKDVASEIPYYLPIKEASRLVSLSKCDNQFFQPHMKIKKALTYVVEGDLTPLIQLIQQNPSLLFEKDQVKAPRGQKYYNVSPYQLMTFLCDYDMKSEIMALECVTEFLRQNENYQELRKQQYAEIAYGGSDLVSLDIDPMEIIAAHSFKGLTQHTKAYMDCHNTQHELTFPLLQNPDGIIAYQDDQGELHFYYVNQETETIKPLQIDLTSDENKIKFEQLQASFNAMEKNSSRRSSDKEHQIIKQVLGCTIVQNGIWYKHKDVLYRDSRTPFNLINAYRKCIRLHQEEKDDEGNTCWREEVGGAQGEEMRLLQLLCEDDHSFIPLDLKHKNISRDYMVLVYSGDGGPKNCSWKSVFKNGVIKISDAIYKSLNYHASSFSSSGATGSSLFDLIALLKLIAYAKENVIELDFEQKFHMTHLP